jgi:quinol monooxygenase YgiN
MGMITLTAKLKAKPGKEDALRKALLALVEPSRAEAGCIEYILHAIKDDPAAFLFYEIWKDQAALDLHVKTETFTNFIKVKPELVDGDFEIVVLNKL